MATTEAIDWSRCELVEVIPGKVGGVPLLRGTRLPAQTIVDNYEDGLPIPEIADQFEVPEEKVRATLKFAEGESLKSNRHRAHTS